MTFLPERSMPETTSAAVLLAWKPEPIGFWSAAAMACSFLLFLCPNEVSRWKLQPPLLSLLPFAPALPNCALRPSFQYGVPIMKLHLMLGAVVISCAVAFPAAAQFGQVERSQAEIALEEAQARQAKQKVSREAAEAACAENDMEG